MIEWWWNWVVPLSVQLAVLGVVAFALDRGLQGWLWPQQRAWIWALCMLKLLLPPTLRSPVSVAQVVPAGPTLEIPASIAPVAFYTWVFGLLALGSYGSWRHRREARARRADLDFALPEELRVDVRWCARRLGLKRPPTVALGSDRYGPAVLGVWRPVVALPAAWCAEMDVEQRRHVLLHEFGHLARRDPVWSAVTLTLQLLYWFHPVVWLAQRRLSLLREEACDALAHRHAGCARGYRSTLLQVAARAHDIPATGLGFVSPSSQLVARLHGLDRWSPRHATHRRLTAVVLLLLLAACVAPLGRIQVEKLPGCLPLRFQVLSALAQQSQSTPGTVHDEVNQP